MNNKLPYEYQLIQKLQDISLPDENAAWKNMSKLLEKDDDDDDIIVPPVKGCSLLVLIGVILLVLVSSLLFWNKMYKHQNNNEKNIAVKKTEEKKYLEKRHSDKINVDSFKKNFDTANINKNNPSSKIGISKAYNKHQLNTNEKKNDFFKQYQHSAVANIKKVTDNKNDFEERKSKLISKNIFDSAKHIDTAFNHQNIIKNNFNYKVDSGSLNQQKNITSLQPDSASKKIIPSAKQDSSKNKSQTKKSIIHNNISFGAGFAVYQQLPLKGQTFVPYNAEGRKGSLLDYIPSVFLRAYYKEKLFLQLNFRYGVPQLTKQFTYNTRITYDTTTIIITSSSLKKIYYHQLPLSIHYNIMPQLSVGAGIVWNRFSSAVIQQDINTRNMNTGDTTFTSKIVNIKKDSSLSTSYLQALFEAEYSWKRFSLGVMYSRGLQPYIKYKDPSGISTIEKNSSLQIFLRYELWRSKKK